MKCFVLNGWAASAEAGDLCRFPRERVFSYVEELDQLHRQAISETDAAIVVGWSMGASMALSLAMDFPGKVKGLVLLAPTPRMMEDKADGWRGMSPRRLDALRRGLELTGGQVFFGIPEGGVNPYMMDDAANLERGLDYLRSTDLRSRLEENREALGAIPVSIFQSRRDGIVRLENAHYLKRILPDCVLTEIDGTEHALPVAIPGLVDRAVFEMMGKNEN